MKSIIPLCATSRIVFVLAIGITLCLFLTAPCPSQAFRKTSEAEEFQKPGKVQAEFLKAIQRKDAQKIRELVAGGADVNTEFVPGFTPLTMAATNGDIETVRTLLELGADINYKGLNMTALSSAVFAKINGKEIVTMLLEAGADPDLHEESLIYLAKLGGKNEMAAFLEEILPAGEEGEAGGQAEADAHDVATRNIRSSSSYRENAIEPIEGQAYPSGDYIGPCEISSEGSFFSKDPKPGDSGKYSFTATIFLEGRRVKKSGSDEDAMAFIAAFITSKHSVRPPECEPVSLGPDGDYTKVVVRSVTDWIWECSYNAPPGKCLRQTRREKNKTWQSVYTYFNISKTAAAPPAVKKPGSPKVTILSPEKGEQFAFDSASPGMFFINLQGEVEDCDKEITWEVEEVGNSDKIFDPPIGDSSQVRFRGLPQYNSDFGKKKITARACGKSDSVEIEVFFTPTALNHPQVTGPPPYGGSPNWFYYWAQTSAGKGGGFYYEEVPTCTPSGVGRYIFREDKIYLYPALYNAECMKRDDGQVADGIDCFGETIRHEKVHQRELKYWWNNIPGKGNFPGIRPNKPSECDDSLPVMTYHGTRNMFTGIDTDVDSVPDYIEDGLAGCRSDHPISCPGIPKQVIRRAKELGKTTLDADMNSYRISWKQWPLGGANSEDWSRCGKQWRDEVKECLK
ncbi:MAG: ankyrin repeat domain-containing protein [Desulfobulbaceae bacterium]|nr:ankyrin repeat domain-containing protein [Desulfobulbaceae bacterium]